MENFRKILYVSNGLGEETAALKQAFRIARNNKAALKALVACPSAPKFFDEYKEKYHDGLKGQIVKAANIAREELKMSADEQPLAVEVEGGSTPAIRVVRHVIADAHDLVIKEASLQDSGKGFRSMDMELLRKSPCPVWLSRPIEKPHDQIRVAVAIDPEGEEVVGRQLALKLLKTARALADTCNGTLSVLSCWDYELENYLTNNSWIRMSSEELSNLIAKGKDKHNQTLKELIEESGIGGDIQIHHERGKPEKVIPDLVEKESIDILVMGTVARVGIQGFLMGNTAENILQNLRCSLWDMKPNGFVSPVKAY
jgi:nucleotide-binding universal stress UspA family protein